MANAIIAEDDRYKRLSLADPIKEISEAMVEAAIDYLSDFGPDDLNLPDVPEVADHKTFYRPLFQWVGTELGRQFVGPDTLWIDWLLADVAEASEFDDKFTVCDDIQSPNEADALRAAGFVIVRVVRPESGRLASLTEAGGRINDSHACETQIADIREDIGLYVTSLDDIPAYASILCAIAEEWDTMPQSDGPLTIQRGENDTDDDLWALVEYDGTREDLIRVASEPFLGGGSVEVADIIPS